MKKAIRIIDIAHELGYSRNTVAKALNGQPIPEKTRRLVFEKAIELGYKSLGEASSDTLHLTNRKVLLLTSHPLANLTFFMAVIKGVELTVRQYNIELLQYTFNPTTTYRELSQYLKGLQLDGIICLETFDPDFIHHVLALSIPTIFIDFNAITSDFPGQYDIVMMENSHSVATICQKLIGMGKTSFGFVGDYLHCRGFYERFFGLREALFLKKIAYNEKFSLTMPDSFPYGNVAKMRAELQKMEIIPEVFICANDSIAIPLIKALGQLGKKVPTDISVVGFDDAIEGRINVPKITTVQVDKEYLGWMALNMLVNRIRKPNEKNQVNYIETTIAYRESTPVMK